MHRLSVKQNKPNSTDPENNLGAGAVNVRGLRTFPLTAVRFDAYVHTADCVFIRDLITLMNMCHEDQYPDD